MSGGRVYKTEAVVLRRRPLGEADRILTLYAADLGKFEAVAKGVRRPGSRKAGHLEPLTHVALMLARGRNLDIITQAEARETFLPLRADVQRLAAGLYVAELVDRLTVEHVEGYSIFRLLVETLARLATAANLDIVLRFFEINLLAHAGYRPELRRCVICQTPLRPVTNRFSPAGGGVVCPTCTPPDSGLQPLSVTALKVLRLLQDGRYTEAAALRIGPELAAELETHLRAYLRAYTDRDIASQRFLNALRREPAGPLPAPAVLS